MHLESRAFRLAVLASVALSAAAIAQTPPAQTEPNPSSSQNPPGQVNPQDQSTVASPPAGTAEQTGVAGGTSGGRNKAEEEIVVTGSRVRRKDLTTPAPVTVINREQIVSSGIAAIGDYLQQMPEQGGAVNTNVNNGGDGETAIALRLLGAQRTLVLVDGKRWVNGGSGAGSFVDLNSIPTASIERVEVLKDGASAVYGSDAIAGVVNIITRRRMNGVEFSAYGGLSPHGDAQQYDLSVTGGTASDRGSFMFSAGYFDQKAMFAGARDWSKSALTYDYTVPAGDPGQVTKGGSPTIPVGRAGVNLNNCNGNPTCNALNAAFHTALCGTATTCNKTFIYDNTSPACASGFVATSTTDFTQCQINNWRPMVGVGLNKQNGTSNDLYNFQAVNYLITPSQRVQLFSNGDFNISNSARAYFQGSFVNRQSETVLAPEPLNTSSFGTRMGTNNVYNPFGATCAGCAGGTTGQSISAARRLTDAGGRSSSFDLDTIRAVAGVDGTLPEDFGPLQGVFWDVSFNYGRTWGTTTYNGSVNTGVTAQALSHTNANGTQCLDASGAVIAGCTPANLFGGPGTLTQDMLNSMGIYTGVNSGWTQMTAVQANLSSELFKLYAEQPVGVAAGYEYRNNYGGFTPDPIGAAGLSFDFNSLPTKGSYHVNEGYAELNMPLLGNMPGAEIVELQAAARVFDYSTFGSDWTYKLGARWSPIRDVTLRGTWGTGFRAPGVSDLYGGQAPSAEVATDPCAQADPTSALGKRCNQAGSLQGAPSGNVAGNGDPSQQINSTIGGNAKLQPEKADIGTIGVVFEPRMVRGLSFTVDYYNIKVKQNIGNITTPLILQGCYAYNNDAACKLVTRDDVSGQITNVDDRSTNVGNTQTSGIDFAVRYSLPTDYGRFGFLFDSNYLIYYRQTLGSGATFSAAGNYDLGSGSALGSLTPKVKFNAGINWGIAGFQAGVRARYIGPFDECAGSDGASDSAGQCSLPVDANGFPIPSSPYAAHHVPAYVTFDLMLSYLYRNPFGNTTLAVGMRNIADATPPYVYNETFIFTDPGYDLVGRFVYGRISHAF